MGREGFFRPNSVDEKGRDIWSPWESLGLHYLSYSGQVDLDALAVLKGIRDKKFNTDIAAETGLSPSHVELWQTLFCQGWCEYGTSPRGCWIEHDIDADALVAAFETYYEQTWGEKP